MQKTSSNKLHEEYYSQQLANGLQLIVFQKPEFVTTTAVFATPYGAFDFRQLTEENQEVTFPAGIAHFLEHKMFESDGKDVMAEFSAMGANVNAFTSYTETAYYFSTSAPDIAKPLNLLLDFVQKLDLTTESVEKEKGIIAEELNMYLQMPDSRLLYETFKNIYHLHPLSVDIGGSVESVYQISKEDLEYCHQLNYDPSRMILVVAGPHSAEEILAIVEKNQSAKTFTQVSKVRKYPYNEPKTCSRSFHEIKMAVNQKKVSVAFKLNLDVKYIMKRYRWEWALRYLLDAHFSPTAPQFQDWLDKKVINDYFGYEVGIGEDYGFLMFYGEHDDAEVFKQFITHELQQIKNNLIAAEVLQRFQRRYYGHSVMLLNQTEEICFSYVRNVFAGLDFFPALEVVADISVGELEEIYSLIDLDNSTVLVIDKL